MKSSKVCSQLAAENKRVELCLTLRTSAATTGAAAEGGLRLSRSGAAKKCSEMELSVEVNPAVV